ncbi:MAG: response regulator transcription factor [Oscillospiraceae bacterium]|jgi:DNA-binding LytR/AlgR family response regulator|nr:response regulator transcription factor [Oscillospiraceae bacterium]
MTISILVCDDLPEERMNLVRMLRHYEQEKGLELRLETAADGSELLAMWKPDRWDLIYLDIFMPQVDGIEAARKLRKVDDICEIVFATTSRRHGMEGYEIHALDYLTKPFAQSDVDSVMDWFMQQRAEKCHALTVRTAEGEESIRAKDILYIESRGHSCVIHAREQEISVRGSIDELAAGLDAASFFRCHKSFLLNFAHVAEIEQRVFRLDSGETVPISAANLTSSKSALMVWRTQLA